MARSRWPWWICQRDNRGNPHKTLPCSVVDGDSSAIRKKDFGERLRGLGRDGTRKLVPHFAAVRAGHRLPRWTDPHKKIRASALADMAFRAGRPSGHRTRAFCAAWAIRDHLKLEIGRPYESRS